MPTIQAQEVQFKLSPDGRTAALQERGQLDIEPTIVLLPFPMIEAFVFQEHLRRAYAKLKSGGVVATRERPNGPAKGKTP